MKNKYYVVDDNNNGFWKDELSEAQLNSMIYNPKTDVYHTKRNYERYRFMNCRTNPRFDK